MENSLPKVLKEDLEGFRGFGVTEFPLMIERKDNLYIAHYTNEKAGCSLFCEVGKTENEVVSLLTEKLKMYKMGYNC